MFFVASKILGFFVLPLSIVLLALLRFWALSRRREKPAWRVFWFAFLLLWLCSMPWGADVLLWPLEGPFEHAPPPLQADVILVLGGALDLAKTEPGRLEYTQASDRFMYAVKLAQRFPQATVIFAGGTTSFIDKAKTEASLLQAEAVAFGVPAGRIRVDDRSRNTHENALEARRILSEVGGRQVVVLTSAFHMRRSLGCLRQVGIEAMPYAVDFRNHRGAPDPFGWVPQASRLDDATAAIREYVGLVVYRVKGYI
jgi:uncharacterized SAM-binding protein YcdF (DUF218 family)